MLLKLVALLSLKEASEFLKFIEDIHKELFFMLLIRFDISHTRNSKKFVLIINKMPCFFH